MTWLDISNGPADACVFLAASALPGPGTRIVLYDRHENRCSTVTWKPDTKPVATFKALSAELPEDFVNPSAAGGRLVVPDADERIFGVNLDTGAVSQLDRVDGTVALSPCGTWLIEATDEELRAIPVRAEGTGAALGLGDPVAVLAKEFDNPSTSVIVGGDDAGTYEAALGCYGYIELATITIAQTSRGLDISAQARTVQVPDLPYDPVWVNLPPMVIPALAGPIVYAMAEAGSAFAAIDTRSGEVTGFSRGAPGYGSLRHVISSLDSLACLVETRDDGMVRWTPGKAPEYLELVADRVLSWQGDTVLVMDRDSARIREVNLMAAAGPIKQP